MTGSHPSWGADRPIGERLCCPRLTAAPCSVPGWRCSGGFLGGRLHGWPQSQRGAAASVPRQRAAPPSPWNGKQLPDSPGDGPARPCSPGGNQLPGLVLSRETQQPGQDGGGPSSVWAGRTQATRGARQCSSGFASAGRPALRSPAPWTSRRHPQGRSWGIAAPAAQLVLEGRAATPWRLPGARKLSAPPL